ncbi:RNA recognition motif domain-containing protein [Celerinatantimonas sp. MCCC 1A17872]|uniref:RNA recognition motif domain-containing protein n=1 Tax=Celerinatantimonas sp. MCCC 1A17872 TaxID=3177514 RepID=UPI0038C1745D
MKTPLSLSIILTIVCAVVLAVLTALTGAKLSAPMAMSIGSIITGLVVAFVRPSSIVPKSEPSSSSESTQTLYVGNLPYRANETAVRELFAQYGHVVSVRLLKDKHTGKRRGFGFVEMSEEGALEAQNALNEQEFQHRTLKVRPANERKDHSLEED